MFLDQFSLIHGAQLSFFDHELAADGRVIYIDRLPEDNRGNRIMHTAKTDAVEIHGEEVGAFANFQTANIASSQHCCSTARAEIQRFAGGHKLTNSLTLPSSTQLRFGSCS